MLWHRWSPLLRGLVLFAGLCLVISFVQYFVLGHVSSLNFTRQFLLWHRMTADDSWGPMHHALQYFLSGGDQTIYAAVFFGAGEKFQYPPLSLVLIWPFAKLPYDPATSNFTLNVTSWIAVLATAVVVAAIFRAACRRYLPAHPVNRWPEQPLLLCLTALFTFTYFPIVHAFHFGQIQTWINFLFSAIVLAWMTDRKALAGLLAALICVMKPQFGLLLLWGALRGQWRFTAWFAGAALIFLVLSVAIFGVANHVDYLGLLSYLSRHGESLILNQSFNGLLHRLLHNGAVVFDEYARLGAGEWVPPYNRWVHIGTLASTVLIVALALFWRRREHERDSLGDLLIAALSFTLASPIAWTHHYGVLLPMFAVALPAALGSPRLGSGTLAALAVAYVLTGNFFKETERLADTPVNFLISYMYFGALLLLWQLYRLRHAQNRAESAYPVAAKVGQPSAV
jgi:hypothetical protein